VVEPGLSHWPSDAAELETLQRRLARLQPESWVPGSRFTVGGCFVCFGRGGSGPGEAGDRGWAAAVVVDGKRVLAAASRQGEAGAPYRPGLLAAREGALLESAVRALQVMPDVLLVNATGRDHPRRAGLAVHLGWVLGIPTVGVTDRPLVGSGDEPGPSAGSHSVLQIGGEQVGWWVRTRPGSRPVAVTPAWRTDLSGVVGMVVGAVGRSRTPAPIREARRLARTDRSESGASDADR
jgi:deoxyribonuclease V